MALDRERPLAVSDSDLWGVSNVSSFVLENLAQGHTYTLTKVQLVRKDHSALTFLPGYKAWVQAYPAAGGTTTYYRRFADGDTDGRRSLESPDYVWFHNTGGGGSDTYGAISIQGLVQRLQGATPPAVASAPTDGWTATDSKPAPVSGCPDVNGNYALWTCYLNSACDSTYLYGAGALYNGKGWAFGFDLNAAHTLSVSAQTIFDSIDWYPGCGDVWGWSDNSYGGALQIAAAKILRGQAMGLALDANGKPAKGGTTTYTDPLTNPWATTQDGDGNVTQAVDPVGATRSAAYTAQGLPQTVQDALGRVTSLAYDSNGRLTSLQNPRGQTATFTYDSYGNCLSAQDPENRLTTYTYGADPSKRQLASLTTPVPSTYAFLSSRRDRGGRSR